MSATWKGGWVSLLGIVLLCGAVGCDAGGGVGIDLDDILNINGNDNESDDGVPDATIDLDVFARNTGGATGIALRPSDGALFLVNPDGLFGPIEAGADVSALTPIGATNLATPEIFDEPQTQFVLAITNSGEFWIGSSCCKLLAVVAPGGGDAVPFEGLLEGVNAPNIAPTTMVIVPAGFEGAQIRPGNLLVGEDTTFSRLAAIDVDGDRTVIGVDNPLADAEPDVQLNRQANHLTFSPDSELFSGRSTPAATLAGIQTIAADGTPADVAGTFSLGVDSFVVRSNGDLVIRGSQRLSGADALDGILLWSASAEEVSLGLSLPSSEISEGDEMIATQDGGTIFLSLPLRNEVLRVVDAD